LGKKATGDLTLLLTALQTTCKTIAMNVRRARLLNLWAACTRSQEIPRPNSINVYFTASA